jgi:hypothetical protein
LLVFDTLIHGEENVEFGCLRRGKKFAIPKPGKSAVTGCLTIMTGQQITKSLVNPFVDENAP